MRATRYGHSWSSSASASGCRDCRRGGWRPQRSPSPSSLSSASCTTPAGLTPGGSTCPCGWCWATRLPGPTWFATLSASPRAPGPNCWPPACGNWPTGGAMTTPNHADEFRIEAADPRDPDAALLIARLTEELSRRYEEEDGGGGFRVEHVLQPRSVFVVGWLGGRAVACGALRPLQGDTAEVKRMYVEPDVRGRGLGRRILAELETHARRWGYTAVWLETGVLQPEAIRIFETSGYHQIENYGH